MLAQVVKKQKFLSTFSGQLIWILDYCPAKTFESTGYCWQVLVKSSDAIGLLMMLVSLIVFL